MKSRSAHIFKITLALCIATALVFGALPGVTSQAAEQLSTSVYTINRAAQIMHNIPHSTSAAELIADMDNDAQNLSVHAADGSAYSGEAVGTGMTIRLGGGEDELTLVVCGDISGDGKISITDYTLCRLSILGLRLLEGEMRTAADINGDGRITITDYSLMRLDILGLHTIVPGQDDLPLAGLKIGLDPGHQRYANRDQELISPTGTETKNKVSSGTYGRFSGVKEYIVNLQVGFLLRDKLTNLGATVIMTRESHDVDISNAERAVMMNNVPVDCWLRIHADGSSDPEKHGMSILTPEPGCMNTTDISIAQRSALLAADIIGGATAATGAQNRGVVERDDQTGFCWSSVMVCTIEMGFMTNETEDWLLISSEYQELIAEGIVSGFLEYYSG